MGDGTALRMFRLAKSSICASCRSRLIPKPQFPLRQFSSNPPTSAAGNKEFQDPVAPLDQISGLNSVAAAFQRPDQKTDYGGLIPPPDPMKLQNLVNDNFHDDERHHLHIYATKHNTHLTLTKPNRDALISVSCGNIGFRGAGRGSYDAAYQLASFVMSRIQDKGLLMQIERLELIYRGFGSGREAVTKAILGTEGRNLRGKIVRLTDATRLKFGGVRSKKPRRLG